METTLPDATPVPRRGTKRLGPLPFVSGALLAVVAAAALSFTLPYDGYLRFQQFRSGQLYRTRWLYERLRFDPEPIDIALIGSSQTQYGVSARIIERELATQGLPGLHVANLSVVLPGEDLHAALVHLLVEAKRPRIIILATPEQMTQTSHLTFSSLLDSRTVAGQTFFGNRAYFRNLLNAVYVQCRMAVVAISPSFFGFDESFRPDRYGADPTDVEGNEQLPDGHVVDHTSRRSLAFLEANRADAAAQMHTRVLGPTLEPYQFGVPRAADRDIADTARRAGARLVFLYQPMFRGAPVPREHAFYDALAPTVIAGWGVNDPRLFSDALHRNRAGATILSIQLARWLAGRYRAELSAVVRKRRGLTR